MMQVEHEQLETTIKERKNLRSQLFVEYLKLKFDEIWPSDEEGFQMDF